MGEDEKFGIQVARNYKVVKNNKLIQDVTRKKYELSNIHLQFYLLHSKFLLSYTAPFIFLYKTPKHDTIPRLPPLDWYEGTEKHTIFILTLIKKKKSIRVFMILVDFLLDEI